VFCISSRSNTVKEVILSHAWIVLYSITTKQTILLVPRSTAWIVPRRIWTDKPSRQTEDEYDCRKLQKTRDNGRSFRDGNNGFMKLRFIFYYQRKSNQGIDHSSLKLFLNLYRILSCVSVIAFALVYTKKTVFKRLNLLTKHQIS